MRLTFLIAAIGVATLGACATAPKPCTAEWIDYRTDAVLRKFAVQNRGLVGDLRDLVRADGDLDPVQAILLTARARDIQQLARSFETVVIPEIDSAIAQCGSNADFVPAFTEFLRREGVKQEALDWVGPILALAQVMRDEQGTAAPLPP